MCLFSDKNGVLFCILFYLVYLCRNDDEKVIRTDSWIIKINNDNETCFFDNGSWQFTASQGIAVAFEMLLLNLPYKKSKPANRLTFADFG